VNIVAPNFVSLFSIHLPINGLNFSKLLYVYEIGAMPNFKLDFFCNSLFLYINIVVMKINEFQFL